MLSGITSEEMRLLKSLGYCPHDSKRAEMLFKLVETHQKLTVLRFGLGCSEIANAIGMAPDNLTYDLIASKFSGNGLDNIPKYGCDNERDAKGAYCNQVTVMSNWYLRQISCNMC